VPRASEAVQKRRTGAQMPHQRWLLLTVLLVVTACCASPSLAHLNSRYADPDAPRDHSEGNRDILVLGGNGFIGSHTVERLASRGYNVTTLHRNNTYWQWHSSHHSRVLTCDRNFDLTDCASLSQLEARPFLAVIDLSGYADVAVMQSVQLLTGRFQYYVYLSTDSVYDVSDKRHAGRSRESDGAFPSDAALRNRLRAG
uniref:Epimerase domain-containing protein n=1 Tax=Macrostomum lignano TaxID=282301 RepID=A0A1I8H6I5_9PLAT